MDEKVFIPKKIKIGFNSRSDTYTGKLGYVIYHDGKVWRKEKSWESWREHYISPEDFQAKREKAYNEEVQKQTAYYNNYKDKAWVYKNGNYSIADSLTDYLEYRGCHNINAFSFRLHNSSQDVSINPVEYENTPLEGFVLNKKVGGYKSHWDVRATYCRVYDPRGFEFEISIPNLLYILQNTSCTVGKGLEGKFIYGWQGTELVLIPETSPEFEAMKQFTDLQDGKVLKKSLVKGGKYLTAKNQEVVFLEENYIYDYPGICSVEKVLWFSVSNNGSNGVTNLTISQVKKYTGEIVDNYAELFSKLENYTYYKPTSILKFQICSASDVSDDFEKLHYSYTCKYYVQHKHTYKGVYIVKKHNYEKHIDMFYIKNSKEDGMSITELLNKYTLYKLLRHEEI